MTDSDSWPLYVDTRDRFIELLRSLDAEEADRPVPHCPEWTVVGVAAHVCGLNSDLASGMREGLGTNASTARQVADRADLSLDAICDEWEGHGEAVRDAFGEAPALAAALVADLVIHLHDVQHALGLAIDRDDEATIAAGRRYVGVMQLRALDGPGLGVAVELSDGGEFPVPDGSSGSRLELRTTAYDFLRSYTGRRSRSQVEALDWTGDPTRLLDEAWSPYGEPPMADSDV